MQYRYIYIYIYDLFTVSLPESFLFLFFLKVRDKLTAPLSVAFLRKPETAGILASVWVFIFQTGLKERRERNATSIQRHAVR